MKIVIVTSSRDWHDHQAVTDALAQERIGTDTLIVRHGACPRGGDDIASRWARHYANYGIVDDPRPAAWDLCGPECSKRPHRRLKKPGDIFHPGKLNDYCPGAGPRRNRLELVAPGADLCLALILPCPWPNCRKSSEPHGSHGASGCADMAEAAGIKTVRYPLEMWGPR